MINWDKIIWWNFSNVPWWNLTLSVSFSIVILSWTKLSRSSTEGITVVKTIYINLALNPLLWSVLVPGRDFFCECVLWYLYLNFFHVLGWKWEALEASKFCSKFLLRESHLWWCLAGSSLQPDFFPIWIWSFQILQPDLFPKPNDTGKLTKTIKYC